MLLRIRSLIDSIRCGFECGTKISHEHLLAFGGITVIQSKHTSSSRTGVENHTEPSHEPENDIWEEIQFCGATEQVVVGLKMLA